MTKPRPYLKCFIACAFKKPDVEEVYKRAILPILKEKRIQPRRVDKKKDNDDIDVKIVQYMEECDFCIADLTYARPSVYYEAGYVSGKPKGVIFIAREDHFDKADNDPHGNECVHFDLNHKDINPWPSTLKKLGEFKRKLRNSINAVTRPIILRKRADQKRIEEEKQFSSDALEDKFRFCDRLCKNAIRRRGYSASPKPKNFLDERLFTNMFIAVRRVNGGFHAIMYSISNAFTKREIFEIYENFFRDGIRDYLASMNIEQHEIYRYDILCISYKQVPDSRVLDALPSFSKTESPGGFSGFTYAFTPADDGGFIEHEIPVVLQFLFPRSYKEIRLLLKSRLDQLVNLHVARPMCR